jgi:hypothetical protein
MADTPEYFHLRPEVEKAYGYTHAVKIGSHIKTWCCVASTRRRTRSSR